MSIATQAPIPVQDFQVRWVTRLLTLLPGSLGILTVSFMIAAIHVLCYSKAYTH
jgi:hypothetical protein